MNRSVFQRRVYFTGFILLVVVFFFILKLFSLHFSDKIILPEKKPINTGRGYILDRNGFVLAVSIKSDSLFANPEEIGNPVAVAKVLSPVVGISQKTLIFKFKKAKRFVWIKRKCDDSIADKIRDMGIKGLHFRKEYRRIYPYDNLASNIIGFVGTDNKGLGGVEYGYDSILSGHDEVVKDEISRDIYQKKNVRLTIDRYIQHVAEAELKGAVEKHRAKQAAAVVLEVGTGRILALAKYPSFNPNFYHNYSGTSRNNFSVADSFEPGSTLKVIAVASLLKNRPGVMKEKFTCKGSVDVNGVVINCLHVHGEVDVKDVIRYSCNAGMIQSVQHLSRKAYYQTLRQFGFGKATGAGLPGETDGILRPVSTWSGISKYSMAIGHEISVTSIQMAGAFGAIANDGVYMMPSILEGVEKPDGTVVKGFYPRSRGRIIKSSNAAILMKLMRGVVETGTGKRASSKFYKTLGKTGTSQKFVRSLGEYTDRNVSTFAGIAPFENPKICVFVVIDDPADRAGGGAAAAPVFARIIDRVLPYEGVGGRDVTDLKVRKTSGELDLPDEVVPDFRSMNAGGAAVVLSVMTSKYGKKYSIKGSGTVYAQKPDPGTLLKNTEKIFLYMR